MSEEKLKEIINRLMANSAAIRYGTVSVSLKLHDGKVVAVAFNNAEEMREYIKAK